VSAACAGRAAVPDRAGGAQLRLYTFPRAPVDIAPLFDRLVIFPSTTMLHRLRARPDAALCMHASRCNAVRLALLCTACRWVPRLVNAAQCEAKQDPMPM